MMDGSLDKALYYSRKSLLRFMYRLLQTMFRKRPVPFPIIRQLRKWYGPTKRNPLFRIHTQPTATLNNAFLSSALNKQELGVWTADTQTLNLLEQQVRYHRPELILEFGSGISTICLSRYMCELHGQEDRVYVLSLDQDEQFAATTRQQLAALQMDKNATVIHAPLDYQQLGGRRTLCYRLPHDFPNVIDGRQPDFLFIDGPWANEAARFGTLAIAIPWLKSGSPFFLDDALRDTELEIIPQWANWPGVQIDGIYFFPKGILQGRYVY